MELKQGSACVLRPSALRPSAFDPRLYAYAYECAYAYAIPRRAHHSGSPARAVGLLDQQGSLGDRPALRYPPHNASRRTVAGAPLPVLRCVRLDSGWYTLLGDVAASC